MLLVRTDLSIALLPEFTSRFWEKSENKDDYIGADFDIKFDLGLVEVILLSKSF